MEGASMDSIKIQGYCKLLRENGICRHSGHRCSQIDDPEGQKICEGITKDLKPQPGGNSNHREKPRFADENKADEELAAFYNNHGLPIPKDLIPKSHENLKPAV